MGYDTGLQELEKMILEDKGIGKVEKKGTVTKFDKAKEYVAFQSKFCNQWDLNVACDPSNGMSNLFIKEIMSAHLAPGKTCHYINDTMDGNFPAHEPNPLNEANCEQLKDLVKKTGSDIGVIFDGDADRVVFVDDRGRFVPPDMMILVLSKHFLAIEAEAKILMDIRSSKSVTEFVLKNGGHPHIWKVGHCFAKAKLRELNAIFGGELAGHYYFRDFYNCDSAILANSICLNIINDLKKKGIKLSDFIDQNTLFKNSGEVNFKLEEKQAAMEKVKETLTQAEKPSTVLDFDGYRIEFADYWFNIRMSNTEPYLRLVVEAKTEELLKKKLEEISAIIKSFK